MILGPQRLGLGLLEFDNSPGYNGQVEIQFNDPVGGWTSFDSKNAGSLNRTILLGQEATILSTFQGIYPYEIRVRVQIKATVGSMIVRFTYFLPPSNPLF